MRVDAETRSFRLLFSSEGRFGQVLLSLVAFAKKTLKTPPPQMRLAEARLVDWKSRGKTKH